MKQITSIPHDIVCEFLGCFTLQGSDENQVSIAEQIAGRQYSSLYDLADTIKGYATRRFAKELIEAKQLFKTYYNQQS